MLPIVRGLDQTLNASNSRNPTQACLRRSAWLSLNSLRSMQMPTMTNTG